MPRRRPAPIKTADCGQHRPYASEYEAAERAARHRELPRCLRCEAGHVFHIWQHQEHYHCGHRTWVPAGLWG